MTNDELKANHPSFYRLIECDSGWNWIIDEVFTILKGRVGHIPGFRFTQIKEKLGGLRMYFEPPNDYISGVVRMAESVSFRTCEVTGRPGERCKKGGWIKTLCKEEAERLGFTPTKGG